MAQRRQHRPDYSIPPCRQSRRLLGQQQRQLKGNAINPVVVKEGGNVVDPAQDIVPVDLGNLPLVQFIDTAAVVPGQSQADQQEKAANQQSAVTGGGGGGGENTKTGGGKSIPGGSDGKFAGGYGAASTA